jgi:hypothetical protein
MYVDSPAQKSASRPQRVAWVYGALGCVSKILRIAVSGFSLRVPIQSVAPGTTYPISLSLMDIRINL